MKKAILTLFVALICFSVYGQSNDGTETKQSKKDKITNNRQKCRSLYIALSGGFNNNTGIVGVNADWSVADHFALEAGGGFSTWGEKLYIGGKYFLKPCHLGWAFGTGITYNTGISDFHDNLETIDGDTEPVDLKLYSQTNMLLAVYRYWNLGKGSSRFYLELGYSISFSSDKFTQIDGTPISDNSTRAINLTSPGGLIAAIGFSFGVK